MIVIHHDSIITIHRASKVSSDTVYYSRIPSVSQSASESLVVEIQHAPLLALRIKERADDASRSLGVNVCVQ
jgi:hypothetical protein